MPFSAVHDLSGLSMNHALDPPFRAMDFAEDGAVRTVAGLLRALWSLQPSVEVDNMEGNNVVDDDARCEARIKKFWEFAREHARLSSEEQAAMPRANKEHIHSVWRETIYTELRHVFFDCANFLWDVNGRTIGHWHPDGVGPHSDKRNKQLVLYHGQKGSSNALQHTFTHNVLLIPAFLDIGVVVRTERLPTDGAGTGYVLESQQEVGTWNKDNETKLWFIRRDVPMKFHVEPSLDNEEVVERTGVAAVLVYTDLCLENHPETEE